MFIQIISLLLDVAVGLVAGAALLRLYMQYQRIPMAARSGNPLGNFIFALTDWIVLPLRKVLPAVGRWDTASLLAVYLLELAQLAVLLIWVAKVRVACRCCPSWLCLGSRGWCCQSPPAW